MIFPIKGREHVETEVSGTAEFSSEVQGRELGLGKETQKDKSSSNPSSSSPYFSDPRNLLDPTQGNTMQCLWGILRIKWGNGCGISPQGCSQQPCNKHQLLSSRAPAAVDTSPELPWQLVPQPPAAGATACTLSSELPLGRLGSPCPGGFPRADGYKQPQAPRLSRDHPECDQSCRSGPPPHSVRPGLNLSWESIPLGLFPCLICFSPQTTPESSPSTKHMLTNPHLPASRNLRCPGTRGHRILLMHRCQE